MYIESADLADKHAEIKFEENCKYVLRDCGSHSGTWVRVEQCNLYEIKRSYVYKVRNY